jgi:hypothetical protein
MSEQQNELFNNMMNMFYSLSFYAPLIICMSVLVFSMFTSTLEKAFVFGVWIFIITFIRILFFKGLKPELMSNIPQICNTGVSQMFIKQDVSYSIYILSFAMMYFILPMIMVSKQNKVNVMNYGILGFFVAYIALDIFIKKSLLCVPSFLSTVVIGNVFSGLFLGGAIGILMYGTTLKTYLYINEINSNKEVCSMPSKQQFRCRVFKDGALIGSSIN